MGEAVRGVPTITRAHFVCWYQTRRILTRPQKIPTRATQHVENPRLFSSSSFSATHYFLLVVVLVVVNVQLLFNRASERPKFSSSACSSSLFLSFFLSFFETPQKQQRVLVSTQINPRSILRLQRHDHTFFIILTVSSRNTHFQLFYQKLPDFTTDHLVKFFFQYILFVICIFT